MSQLDQDDIRTLLQDAFPRVNTELRPDLWPAMSRRLDAQTPQAVWYDWALAGLAASVIVAFPDVILVLLYHL